jgi:uncharacterized membrane protein
MGSAVIAYLGTALVLIGVDAVWLSVMGPRFYRRLIGDQMRERPNWPPAVLFYLGYPAAVVVFAVMPGVADGGWPRALGLGALLGVACYATYDLTNQATLRRWPALLSGVDIAWGAGVTAVAAAAGCALVGALA